MKLPPTASETTSSEGKPFHILQVSLVIHWNIAFIKFLEIFKLQNEINVLIMSGVNNVINNMTSNMSKSEKNKVLRYRTFATTAEIQESCSLENKT